MMKKKSPSPQRLLPLAKRCIVILLDGLGDRAYAELGDRTPLQAAVTPTLDRFAALGVNGLFHAGRLGQALPSENAHFAMFGYAPEEFPGRGLLEAMGAGHAIAEDEIALLAHFVNIEERDGLLVLTEDRPLATAPELAELGASIAGRDCDGIVCRYLPTRGPDGIVTLRGPVSPCITDSDPITEGEPLLAVLPWREAGDDHAARHTARALTAYLSWCHRTLAAQPVNVARRGQGLVALNGLVTQRPGRWLAVERFGERWGLRGLSIASGLVYWGLAEFLGLAVRKVKDSGEPGRDLAERLRHALATTDHDFIHVHTKAPDAAAHTKEPAAKVAAIEALDRGLAAVADELLGAPETLLVITADHSTPSSGPQVHSGEPVPFTMVGPGQRCDLVRGFDEVRCAAGALGVVRGGDFMYLVLNGLDRAKLHGLRDAPEDRPYWPARRTPFRLSP